MCAVSLLESREQRYIKTVNNNVVVVVVVVVVVAFPSLAFWGSPSVCSFFFVSVPCLDISTLVDWA